MDHIEIGPGTLIYTSDEEPQELIPAEGTPTDESDDCPRRRIRPIKLRQQMKLLKDSDTTSSEEFDHSDETNSPRRPETDDRLGYVTDKFNESRRRLLRPTQGSKSDVSSNWYQSDTRVKNSVATTPSLRRPHSDLSTRSYHGQRAPSIYGNGNQLHTHVPAYGSYSESVLEMPNQNNWNGHPHCFVPHKTRNGNPGRQVPRMYANQEAPASYTYSGHYQPPYSIYGNRYQPAVHRINTIPSQPDLYTYANRNGQHAAVLRRHIPTDTGIYCTQNPRSSSMNCARTHSTSGVYDAPIHSRPTNYAKLHARGIQVQPGPTTYSRVQNFTRYANGNHTQPGSTLYGVRTQTQHDSRVFGSQIQMGSRMFNSGIRVHHNRGMFGGQAQPGSAIYGNRIQTQHSRMFRGQFQPGYGLYGNGRQAQHHFRMFGGQTQPSSSSAIYGNIQPQRGYAMYGNGIQTKHEFRMFGGQTQPGSTVYGDGIPVQHDSRMFGGQTRANSTIDVNGTETHLNSTRDGNVNNLLSSPLCDSCTQIEPDSSMLSVQTQQDSIYDNATQIHHDSSVFRNQTQQNSTTHGHISRTQPHVPTLDSETQIEHASSPYGDNIPIQPGSTIYGGGTRSQYKSSVSDDQTQLDSVIQSNGNQTKPDSTIYGTGRQIQPDLAIYDNGKPVQHDSIMRSNNAKIHDNSAIFGDQTRSGSTLCDDKSQELTRIFGTQTQTALPTYGSFNGSGKPTYASIAKPKTYASISKPKGSGVPICPSTTNSNGSGLPTYASIAKLHGSGVPTSASIAKPNESGVPTYANITKQNVLDVSRYTNVANSNKTKVPTYASVVNSNKSGAFTYANAVSSNKSCVVAHPKVTIPSGSNLSTSTKTRTHLAPYSKISETNESDVFKFVNLGKPSRWGIPANANPNESASHISDNPLESVTPSTRADQMEILLAAAYTDPQKEQVSSGLDCNYKKMSRRVDKVETSLAPADRNDHHSDKHQEHMPSPACDFDEMGTFPPICKEQAASPHPLRRWPFPAGSTKSRTIFSSTNLPTGSIFDKPSPMNQSNSNSLSKRFYTPSSCVKDGRICGTVVRPNRMVQPDGTSRSVFCDPRNPLKHLPSDDSHALINGSTTVNSPDPRTYGIVPILAKCPSRSSDSSDDSQSESQEDRLLSRKWDFDFSEWKGSSKRIPRDFGKRGICGYHYSKNLSENMNKNRKESEKSDQPMTSQFSFIYGNSATHRFEYFVLIDDDKIEVDKPVQELYSYSKMPGPFKYYNPGVPLPKEDVGNPSKRKLGRRDYRRLKIRDNARKYGIETFHKEMIASLDNPETNIFLCGSQYPEVKMDSVNSSSGNSSDAASESSRSSDDDFTDCLKDFERDRRSNRKIDLINLSKIDNEIRRKFALSNFSRIDNESNRKIDLGTLSKIHCKSDNEINKEIDVNKSDGDIFNESYSTTEDEIDCKSISQKERNSALKINKILRLKLKKRKRLRMKRMKKTVRLKKSVTRNDCKSDSSENRDCYADIDEFT